MKANDLPPGAEPAVTCESPDVTGLLAPLLSAPTAMPTVVGSSGAVVGELLALADGLHPLVRWPGQAGRTAVRARSTVDLHGRHVGADVLIAFDQGDTTRPIVIGVLRDRAGWPADADQPAQVQVDTEGQRLIVSAKEQLVLRCGKASITLTKAGKVMIEGSYLSSRSTGVNRIKGGSVQLN